MTYTPRFPIYIPSKSRWDSCLTMRALDQVGVDYRVIVEADQYAKYAAVLGEEKLIILDPVWQDTYDPFDGLGRTKPLGPGPARNHAWADAIARGYDWHWVMDDNIRGFYWLRNNQRLKAHDAAPLVLMEDFAIRYRNLAMAGPQYLAFYPSRVPRVIYTTGTRIYSCNLIRNRVPLRWRGRYNEDTDLSIRMLKTGWNTVQFNMFLHHKMPTQKLAGGNTEAFYEVEGTTAKSAMLVAMHPDVARVTRRFGRVHHYVDYRQWLGRPLIPEPDAPRAHPVTTTVAPAGGPHLSGR